MFMILAVGALATVLLAPPYTPVVEAQIVALDSTLVSFARARAEARAGRRIDAMRSYIAGAAQAVSASDWGLYRADISWIATRNELQAFDAASAAGRVTLLRTIWSSRDTRDGIAPGGRFGEHVRRLDIATADFRVRPKRGKVPVARASNAEGDDYDYIAGRSSMLRDFVPTQGMIDDRGVILIRHGEPDTRVVSSGGIESWIYQRETSDNLVVHFGEALFDGSSGNTTLIAAPPLSTLSALCGVDAASCQVGNRIGAAAIDRRERLRQRSLAAIRELTTTESAGPKR